MSRAPAIRASTTARVSVEARRSNVSRPAYTLADLEAFCAHLRSRGRKDDQSIHADHADQLTATWDTT